jgi:hypothetical protein
MTSNEKRFNHKVVDLVESYKFRIKFISIRIHTKMLRFFEIRLILIAITTVAVLQYPNRNDPWRFAPTAVAHGGLPLPPWVTRW